MTKSYNETLRAMLDQIRIEESAERVAAVVEKIDKMRRKRKKYPKFDDFRDAMAQLIKAGWADTLEDAYEIVKIVDEA